ncbi:MAG: hypothetical protein GF364_03130 [Candidatus Lokiarchaeota archaeon]|nr:hypothetical protein [Candidatus Lokiarchaeota archaeon]
MGDGRIHPKPKNYKRFLRIKEMFKLTQDQTLEKLMDDCNYDNKSQRDMLIENIWDTINEKRCEYSSFEIEDLIPHFAAIIKVSSKDRQIALMKIFLENNEDIPNTREVGGEVGTLRDDISDDGGDL